MKRRVFIVEDHPTMREAYAAAIRRAPDLEVCGEATSTSEALAGIADSAPDLVLVDVSLEREDGIALVEELHARYPTLPALVLSGHEEELYGPRAFAAGARGYLMKGDAAALLVAARQVLDGGVYASDRLRAKLLPRNGQHKKPPNGGSPPGREAA